MPLGSSSARFRTGLGASLGIAALYLLGVLHWAFFFRFGRMAFSAQDWPKEYAYFTVLKEAVESGTVPFHLSTSFHGTYRFLALPETLLSPQILLLKLLQPGPFLVANVILLYTVGFVGCLLLRRRFGLSFVPFAALFLLFNFNGYITSHLAVGHSMWVGYFLLPFFFLLLLQLTEAPRPATPLLLALILFAMMLQGAFHMYIWCLLFLGLFAAFNRRYAREVLQTVVVSGVLSAFRLLPAAFAFKGKLHDFNGGYPSVGELLAALTVLRDWRHPNVGGSRGTLGWWEYDLYVGAVGLLFLVGFGISRHIRSAKDDPARRFKAFDGPMAAMALLSFGPCYVILAELPLFGSERISSRFLILPVVLLMIFAAVSLQRMLERRKVHPLVWLLMAGGLVQMALACLQHSYRWRLEAIEAIQRPAAVASRILPQSDPTYEQVFAVSAAISMAALFGVITALVHLAAAQRRKAEQSERDQEPALTA